MFGPFKKLPNLRKPVRTEKNTLFSYLQTWNYSLDQYFSVGVWWNPGFPEYKQRFQREIYIILWHLNFINNKQKSIDNI